jgi:hypothetical protein
MNEEQKNEPLDVANITANQYQSKSIINLAGALVAFQVALSKITIEKDQSKTISFKNKNGGYSKRELKYASFDNILSSTRPLLANVGLTILQALTGEFLTTIILHKSGEQIGFLTPFLPMKGSGTNDAQNVGGGLTYYKRYTYNAALGISIEDDTDGDDQTKTPLEPSKDLPVITEENYTNAANEYLKTGTLDRLRNEFFTIKEHQVVEIFELAKEIKSELKKLAEQQKETDKVLF